MDINSPPITGNRDLDVWNQRLALDLQDYTDNVSGNIIYPENYGTCKADNGSTDSTAAILAAVEALGTDGNILEFGFCDSTHYYSISSDIVIPARRGWTIRGAGSGGSKIVQYTNDKSIFEIGSGADTHSWVIEGLLLTWDTQQTSAHTDSYGIKFVSVSGATSGTMYFGNIRNNRITKGYRGIGTDDKVGDTIAPWMISVRDVYMGRCIGAGIYFESPVAIGQPNNTFENVYVSQRDITPVSPGFHLSVQTEGSMINCAVEGSQGNAVYINSCPSFTVKDMHIESAVFGDATSKVLINIAETNLLWDGGSITGALDTTTYGEVFRFYAGGATAYNNVIIRGVHENITKTAGDLYFVNSLNTYYNISLEGNHTQCTAWYKPNDRATGPCIESINGIFAKDQFLYANGTLTNSGTSWLYPGIGGSSTSHTLPDGDIFGTIKIITKYGNQSKTSIVTVTTHSLGANIARKFEEDLSSWVLFWDGHKWYTMSEDLNNAIIYSSSGAIEPNGSAVHILNSVSGDLSMTLAAANRAGTWKLLTQNVGANKSSISVTNHAEGSPTVFSLDAIHDYVLLMWDDDRWVTINRISDGKLMLPGTGEIGSDVDISKSEPELTLYNTDGEDTDRGRQTKIIFRGIQVSTNQMTLGEIEVSHDGTAADTKGIMIIRVHGGANLDDAIIIDFAGNTGIGVANPLYKLHVNGDVVPATTYNDLGKAALRWDAFLHDVNIDGSVTIDGSTGWNGTFNNAAGATVTVVDGIITDVSSAS